jgi:hypothetical protein
MYSPQMPSLTLEENKKRGACPAFLQKNFPPGHADVPTIHPSTHKIYSQNK